MASLSGLSLEAVRDYMLSRGGKVTNHDLVKHFKDILTNPECRAEARNEFKEIVNTVATIVKSEEGEKYLVLKKRYRTPDLTCPGDFPSPGLSSKYSVSSSSSVSSLVTPIGMGMSHSVSQDSLDSVTSPRNPPPYRPPPPPTPPSQPTTPVPSTTDVDSPPVPPRRKSTEKIKLDNKENSSPDISKRPKPIGAEADPDENENVEDEVKVSVKEYMQKFQRMASESALQKLQVPGKKRHEKGATDREDDSSSVTSLDPKAREWLVRAAQADYQNLAKLALENPRLSRFKDPTSGYTALHWAAKHGNIDVVKLIAGTHEADVNMRTNGGYTPLHLAMQFDHEEVYNILVHSYGADPNLRDWSGRKPRQYQTNKDTAVSADTFRKIKARKKLAEKDLGFLRIGSLNVRVKRTTEAFSQYFLGAGSSTEKLHKTWGSADNIPEVDSRKMPPPKYAPIKKRKSRKAADFTTQSLPLPKSENPEKSAGESDSDTAAGFGTTWQEPV